MPKRQSKPAAHVNKLIGCIGHDCDECMKRSASEADAAPVEQAAGVRGEPWCYGVESTHSGEVVVRETFDDEATAQLHAQMNGGIVVALYASPPNSN